MTNMANNPVAISEIHENVDVNTATWKTVVWSLPPNGSSSSLRHNTVSPSHLLWPPPGVLAVHSLFLYSDPPPLSDWLRLFLSQTHSHIHTPTISSRLFFVLTQPMKME
jgi:hypothetical protein